MTVYNRSGRGTTQTNSNTALWKMCSMLWVRLKTKQINSNCRLIEESEYLLLIFLIFVRLIYVQPQILGPFLQKWTPSHTNLLHRSLFNSTCNEYNQNLIFYWKHQIVIQYHIINLQQCKLLQYTRPMWHRNALISEQIVYTQQYFVINEWLTSVQIEFID